LSQCCGKIPTIDDLGLLDQVVSEPDLSISDSTDPFKDPIQTIKNSHEWITTKGNLIKVFESANGQINYEIFSGPDRGVHRFIDPNTGREGQTGVENPRTGERRHESKK